ncbi:MAG: alkaline phosphatase [Bacteroidaceae bacterium]
MKYRTFFLLFVVAMMVMPGKAQTENVKQVKNLILLIPDGTSLATVSMARWRQFYADPSKPKLKIDPYICGTVRTTSSNAPIGDSAPTTSCYMTGVPSRTGYVATYPVADKDNDIYPMDETRAYQPLTTLLEAAKQLQGRAAGLVFTCQFPHATPADCSAHSYNRSDYGNIAHQMVHNNLDVVIGGGEHYLTQENEDYLTSNGVSVYRNNLAGMRADKKNKMWALYGNVEMDYDIDRDTTSQPSLEEMTRKAIQKLSQNPNGFFLMVEGSKVDWAAHANDPVGMATDMLAFDRACGAALAFAREDGNTAVVIVPDHGNSGISIGREGMKEHYDRMTKDQLFGQFSKYNLTADGLARKLNELPGDSALAIFKQYEGLDLSKQELKALYNCKDYKNSILPKEERKNNAVESMYSGSLTSFLARLLTKHTCFGFTSSGHTGEDVFLAAYHPQGTRPMGMNTNVELHEYLCKLFGLEGRLEAQTQKNFVRHTEVFAGAEYNCTFIPAKDGKSAPTLVVKNNSSKKKITIFPFTNIVTQNKKEISLNSVIVYVDKNKTFYLPSSLTDLLK